MILFILAAIGLTIIMVESRIMLPVRGWFEKPSWQPVIWFWELIKNPLSIPGKVICEISHMLTCHQCTGFWAGLVTGWMVLDDLTFAQWLACGFAGSAVSYSAAVFLDYLQAMSIMRMDDK